MSVSKKARRRGTILDEIMRYKREQLPKVMREIPLADLRALASVAPPTVDFTGILKRPGVSLIAECKKASPSKGLLVPNYDPIKLATAYVQAGASAISVLTDARYFQGSLEDLRDVKETVAALGSREEGNIRGVPVLRKDFIFHPYQVFESRAAGADAILLIAATLEGGGLSELLKLAHELDMEALVEVHTRKELEQVLLFSPRVIGVNNRNLQTFEVDFENTGRLRAMIPEEVAVVGESGIRTAADVNRMRELGVDAILVGETLVRSQAVLQKTRDLVNAGR